MKIGERIRQRRCELGLSQRGLADRMGYNNHSTIAKIEKGEVDIPLSKIARFSEVLDVSVEYLMGINQLSETVVSNDLGQRIKEARIAKGLTQEELGKFLGVEKSAVAKYENGRVVNLKHATIKKLSEILEIPIVELVVGSGEMFSAKLKNKSSESYKILAENLRFYIKRSNKTQSEIADEIGIPVKTFNDWVKGNYYPRIDKLELLANYFGISKADLIEKKCEDECVIDTMDSVSNFATNLRLLLVKSGKTRKEASEEIGVSYVTFCGWCNGDRLPKNKKMEALADYFEVSISDLVGEKKIEVLQKETVPSSKDKVLDIIVRLHTDEEFFKMVEAMRELDSEKLMALKQFLKAFGE